MNLFNIECECVIGDENEQHNQRVSINDITVEVKQPRLPVKVRLEGNDNILLFLERLM